MAEKKNWTQRAIWNENPTAWTEVGEEQEDTWRAAKVPAWVMGGAFHNMELSGRSQFGKGAFRNDDFKVIEKNWSRVKVREENIGHINWEVIRRR